MDQRTVCVHAGGEVDPGSGAVTPPIHLSSTFARDADNALVGEHLYGRYGNPTRDRLERALAELEGGGSAYALPTGLAASMALLQAACSPGDRVLFSDDLYFGVRKQLLGPLTRWGLVAEPVDLSDLDALDAALSRGSARMIWIETPSNPQLRVTDLAAVVARARAAGSLVAVDNTWPSPVLTRPLELGADAVLHSTTKYLGGHSDVGGGAGGIPADSALVEPMLEQQRVGGSVQAPFDCWLLLRGLRTLALRVRAASEGAQALAEFLHADPRVVAVAYPGLPDDPGHAVAARQMRGGFGGMLSARLGSREAAHRFVGALRLWTRATSLGGVESLVEHRIAVEGPDSTTPPDLVRFSVGIEAPEDLIADVAQALDA